MKSVFRELLRNCLICNECFGERLTIRIDLQFRQWLERFQAVVGRRPITSPRFLNDQLRHKTVQFRKVVPEIARCGLVTSNDEIRGRTGSQIAYHAGLEAPASIKKITQMVKPMKPSTAPIQPMALPFDPAIVPQTIAAGPKNSAITIRDTTPSTRPRTAKVFVEPVCSVAIRFPFSVDRRTSAFTRAVYRVAVQRFVGFSFILACLLFLREKGNQRSFSRRQVVSVLYLYCISHRPYPR